MKTHTSSPLACRFCQHYQLDGRRGGHCDKLGVPVKGEWKSCSCMLPCFAKRPPSKTYSIKLYPQTPLAEFYSYETTPQFTPALPLNNAIAS